MKSGREAKWGGDSRPRREQIAGAPPAGNFLGNTRGNIKPFAVMPFSAGGLVPQDLPQSGYGVGVRAKLTGTATASGSATMAAYPPTPWSLVKNLRLFSTDGTELYQTSGWHNYVYQRTLRTGWDPARSPVNFLGGFTDPFTRYFGQTGNLTTGQSVNFGCTFWIPITWCRNWQNSLILLQNTASRYTLEVTWGTVNDLFSAGASNITLSNVQIQPILEFASIPTATQDLPDISYLKQVKEQIQPITGTGTTPYLAPTGNMYLKLISEFINNGAPMDMSKINLFSYNYSQTQYPYQVFPDDSLFEQAYNYGGDLPSAVYVRDFSLGNGFPEIGTFRDVINTARVTNFEMDYTLDSSLSLVNASVCQIREQLLPVRRQ